MVARTMGIGTMIYIDEKVEIKTCNWSPLQVQLTREQLIELQTNWYSRFVLWHISIWCKRLANHIHVKYNPELDLNP